MPVTAWEGETIKSTAIAASDLSSNLFNAVTVGSSGVSLVAAQGAGGVKVLTNKPQSGDPARLIDLGETKMVAGGALVVGNVLMTDSSGRFVLFVNDGTNVPVGECRSPASQAGDIFTGLVFPNVATEDEVPSILDTITAHAAGGQASAVQLVNGWNRVTTVGTAADSVAMPAALKGRRVLVINDAGANAMQVFGINGGTDTIDGTAGATGISVAAGHRAVYFCLTAGAWISQEGPKD